MQVTQFKMRKPDDFHVHVREGAILEEVLPYTVRRFGRALIMPNLKDAVEDGPHAKRYENTIRTLAQRTDGGDNFRPLMTIKLTPQTEPQDIKAAYSCGVTAVKVYPEGVTTNSEGGIKDLACINHKVLAAISECGMVLSIHGEVPGAFCLHREAAFIPLATEMVRKFPALKIVLEHITTADAANWIKYQAPNVAATVTPHHLMMTLDDVIGDKIKPHNFCKPIAKTPADRKALLDAVTKGNTKFFLGTDSAPHTQDAKECSSGCAGCFTAPLAVELLASIFETAGALHALEPFTSEIGARFYGVPLNEEMVTLDRVAWQVPAKYGSVVPFMAGQTIQWSLPFTAGEVGANT